MKECSFIHVSDVHLGHQQFNLEDRFNDFGKAFADVVNYALQEQVDFMIIGGDFFHKRAINAETLKQAMELLQPLKNASVPVIAIEGNHDKAFYQDKVSWLKLLNTLGYLRILKPLYSEGKISLTSWSPNEDGCVTILDNIRLVGLGYLGATAEQRLTELAEVMETSDEFTIMILHGAVNKLLGQDLGGIKKDTLDKFRKKVDYLALGHIHTRDEDGWYFNPGSLENCHIDEAKEGREKGFYHVSINNKEKTVRYIPSKPREIKLLSVDISGSVDAYEVYQRVWHALAKLNLKSLDGPMVQVVLKGDINFSALAIDTGALAKEIKENEQCIYVEVQNSANLPLSDDELSMGEVINRAAIEKQVLYRLLNHRHPHLATYKDQLVELILNIKESALNGENSEEIINQISQFSKHINLNDLQTGSDEVAVGGGHLIED